MEPATPPSARWRQIAGVSMLSQTEAPARASWSDAEMISRRNISEKFVLAKAYGPRPFFRIGCAYLPVYFEIEQYFRVATVVPIRFLNDPSSPLSPGRQKQAEQIALLLIGEAE